MFLSMHAHDAFIYHALIQLDTSEHVSVLQQGEKKGEKNNLNVPDV